MATSNNRDHTQNTVEKLKRQIFSGEISAKSLTAIFLFGAIVLVFVFFGLPTHQGGVGAAAQVNNAYISVADLRGEAARMEQMYGQFMGMMGNSEAQREFIRREALESLITQEVLAQAAQKKGILATDEEIREFLFQDMPVFQKDGRFQRDMYLQVLKANNLSPTDFEERIRKDRQSQRVRRVLEIASQPLDLEVKKELALRSTKFNYEFVRLTAESLTEGAKISDAEVKNKLADAAFKKRVEEEFNSNKAKYKTENEVRAQHILIKAKPEDEASMKKALEKIEALKKRAAKEDFTKLAKESTEDIGSKMNGGDLGWFGKGRMVPEFETVAFSMSIGQLSAPVKSQFGYHLIKLTGQRAGKAAELALWQDEIAKKMLLQDELDAQAKKMEDLLSKGDTAALETLLKGLKVKWEETGYVDMTIENIPKFGSQAASQAAFEATTNGAWVKRMVRDNGQKYLIRLKERKTENIDGKAVQAQIQKDKSSELFMSMVEFEKKSASIQRNPQALSGR